MPPATLTADGVAANNGCIDPANAQGLADGTWTANVDNGTWDCRWTMGDPDGTLAGTQTVTVAARKSEGLGDDPTVTVDLYESGTHVKALASTTLGDASSPGGVGLSGTFEPSDLSGDGSGLQVKVTAQGVGTLLPRNVQVDAVTWDASVRSDGRRPTSDYRRSIRFRGHPR